MVDKYEQSRVAVDAAIFSIQEGVLKVLLHSREKEPFLGRLELPGGLLLPDETAEGTLERKLSQVLGKVNQAFFKQFYTFTNPGRDPRERTISIAFVAVIDGATQVGTGAWYSYSEAKKLAFDHQTILQRAREYLQNNATLLLVKHLIPEHFRLNELHTIFEVLLDRPLDNRNFRRWILATGQVEQTKKLTKNVAHRPARLFRISGSESALVQSFPG